MKMWKALGLAGLAGVAATGIIIARAERRRAQLTPEEVRARLHQRLAAVGPPDLSSSDPSVPADPPAGAHRRWRLRRR